MNKIKTIAISVGLSVISLIALSCYQGAENGGNTHSLYMMKRLPDNSQNPAPLLILLHGYGSNENDLYSFEGSIPSHWMVVSVRGPHQKGENSYCWYDIRKAGDKMIIDAKQEADSRAQLIELIKELTNEYQVDKNNIYLAGFSQGAIMSESIALTHPELVKGFASFSGRLLDEVKPLVIPSDKLKQIKSFISHGTEDKMLTIQYATENLAYIRSLGITPEYVEDATGHVISEKQFQAFLKWLGN